MTVKAIMGFDIAPGALLDPGAPYAPVRGAGMEPYVGLYGLTYTVDNNVLGSIGVTGRTQDQMSNGANAVVAVSGQRTNQASMTIGGTDRPMSVNTVWRYTLGFRFKIDTSSLAPPTGNMTLVSVANSAIVHLNGPTYNVMFGGNAAGKALTPGVEYYFEVVLDYPTVAASGNFSPTCYLYIDGEQIGPSRVSATWSALTNCSFQIGCFGRSGSGTNLQRWLFSDFYITDVAGDAPYNGRMGPQRVRAFYPDEVVENNWVLSEGTDPLALIGQNGRDTDTKFLTAPDDASVTSYRCGFPTNPKSIVNGLMLFGRGKREDGASRPLQATISKANGEAIVAGANVALTTAYATTPLVSYFPTNAVMAANLKDNILQGAVVSLKAPTGA